MIRLTPAIAMRITKDWSAKLPSLSVYKPLQLLRRCEPLLIGICLNRNSDGSVYKPTFHGHCLLRPFPALTLSLDVQMKALNGAPIAIPVAHHDSNCAAAADEMKAIALLPLEGDITLDQFDAACATWMKVHGVLDSLNLMEDRVLIHSWLGEDHRRPLLEAECAMRASSLGPSGIDELGGISAWMKRVDSVAGNKEELARTLDSEIEKHRLARLPVSRLLS